MNHNFVPGEIAIYWNPDSRHHKTELTIASWPYETATMNVVSRTIYFGLCCEADVPPAGPPPAPLRHWTVPLKWIRKRPPDWREMMKKEVLNNQPEVVE